MARDAALDTAEAVAVDSVDSCGRGPLWFACQSGTEELVCSLLAQRASPEQSDLLGWRPLHLASYYGFLAVVQQLLARGCEVNARTNAGQTARWLAHSHAIAHVSAPASAVHKQVAEVLAAAGGSLGLESDGQELARNQDEVRLCTEDGKRYTLEELIYTYAHKERMFSRGECVDYFYREMRCHPDDHAAWQLQVVHRPSCGSESTCGTGHLQKGALCREEVMHNRSTVAGPP